MRKETDEAHTVQDWTVWNFYRKENACTMKIRRSKRK